MKDGKLDCRQAREMLDRRDELSAELRASLDFHLRGCAACAAEARVEPLLREVIAPPALPHPSAGFEARLAARLISTAPRPVAVFRQWIPLTFVAAAVVAGAVSAGLWGWIHRWLVLWCAKGAAAFAGKTALASERLVAQMPLLDGVDTVLALNLVLAGMIIAVGLAVVGPLARRFPVRA